MVTLHEFDPALYAEFWIPLASLLRSYTAAYGLQGGGHADVEADEKHITVRYGSRWLELQRMGGTIAWTREDGRNGTLELTEHGRLRGTGEDEMDMAAEAWARELML